MRQVHRKGDETRPKAPSLEEYDHIKLGYGEDIDFLRLLIGGDAISCELGQDEEDRKWIEQLDDTEREKKVKQDCWRNIIILLQIEGCKASKGTNLFA